MASSEPCLLCHFDVSIIPEPHVRALDVQKVLDSDDAPMGLQFEELKDRLSSALEELHSIDLEMERLSQELLSLFKKRHSLNADIIDLKTVTHPIRRMPPEILFEIFVHCVQQDHDPEKTNLDISQSPWSLTRVCRRWRNIAVARPSLWTDIRIISTQNLHYGLDYHSTFFRWTRLLGIQLIRSRSLPLNLYITSQSTFPRQSSLLALLFSTSPRWKSLSLDVPTEMLTGMSDIAGYLDSLETLTLTWSGMGPPLELFRCTPRLKTLHAAPHLIPLIPAAAGQVESWHVPPSLRWPLNQLLMALPRMKQMTTCDITLGCPGSEATVSIGNPFTGNPIIVPRLEHLHIVDHEDNGHEVRVLQHLILPALKTLSLATWRPLDLACLESLAQRSFMHLEGLCIMATAVTEENAAQLLMIFPELTSLTIESADDDDPVINVLASPTGAMLIPKLQTLTIYLDSEAEVFPTLEQQLEELEKLRPDLDIAI
ncbi:hypothetical protein C8J56DRAFT_938714 [Mycena floridula]|nr:hypothetical protein C8J56DRAFT_938714 [Mycena floridula]